MNSQENHNSVSVIILAWNQKDYLKKCLDSVLAQAHRASQIIVVDNASCDTAVDFLKNNYLNLEIIENKSNLGFAKAVNKGIERAGCDYTLILTADMMIASDCLTEFLKYIESEEKIGLLSGFIFDGYDKKLIFSGKKIKLGWGFKQKDIDLEEKNGAKPTDLIPGGLLFSKTTLLKHFGGFNENYFFYFEDLDLTFSFKRSGFKNLIIPNVKAYHLEGGPGLKKYGSEKKIQFELEKNLLITYFRHAKLFWLILFFIRYMGFSFIKNIFDINRRSIILKTRYWALCNIVDLIKLKYRR